MNHLDSIWTQAWLTKYNLSFWRNARFLRLFFSLHNFTLYFTLNQLVIEVSKWRIKRRTKGLIKKLPRRGQWNANHVTMRKKVFTLRKLQLIYFAQYILILLPTGNAKCCTLKCNVTSFEFWKRSRLKIASKIKLISSIYYVIMT